jgi:Ni/Fe-hydrogenase subunit HybB-like protein
LGSLFLIMPAKLNPLWYSPLLPLFFFLTALAVGLAMVIFESLISARVFRRGLELHLLSRLGKAIPYILGVYLALKLGDLALNGKLSLLFALEPPALLFWLEVMMGSVAPIVVFSRRVWRETPGRLLVGALLIIAGVMLNRFNVSLLTMSHIGGQGYVPSLGEWAISLGIISAGVLAFAFVARFFPLFDVEDHAATHPSSQPIPTTTGA